MRPIRIHGALALLAAVLFAPATASAGEKQFGYVYEPQALPPGQIELEQWITPRIGKVSGVFGRFDMRSEFEIGVIPDLQTSIYLNYTATRVSDARVGRRGHADLIADDSGKTTYSQLEFEGISNEWLYKVSDPVASALGFALYFEWTTNGSELELEEKVILAKTWGGFTVAANFALEEEWRSGTTDEAPRELTAESTLGAAYRIPNTPVGVGLEFRNVHVLERWGDYKHSLFALGPNVHLVTGRFWATLTVMPQLGSVTPSYKSFDYDGFEKFEARIIFGIEL